LSPTSGTPTEVKKIIIIMADMAATRKTEKYSTLSSAYRFEPIAVENLGVFSSTTLNFISELGRRICVHTGNARETSYAFLSRYNASTLFFCTTLCQLTCRTYEHPILILAFLVF